MTSLNNHCGFLRFQVFEGVLVDPMEHFSLFDARGKGVVRARD